MSFRTALLTLSAIHLVAVPSFAVEPASFLKQHCVRCHGVEKQEGDLRLDRSPVSPNQWLGIADRLELGEMPPEGATQPSPAEVQAMVSLAKQNASQASHAGQVVLRRLNRTQYRNTLRDLLKIDTFVEDPTEAFPADDEKEGFDNLGESLQMSDFLLRQYLARRAKGDRRCHLQR